jgi:dTDP-4-dehydrorhamnose 3,5-epimerase
VKLRPLPLAGLSLVLAEPSSDERGLFARVFCERELAAAGWSGRVVQANLSRTRRQGALRGLHYQRPPMAEVKVVRCLRGAVFDVAVDLRRGSPTFLGWHGEVLSGDNLRALYIPEGFAHGFQTLEPECEMLYLHGQAYSPEHEGAVRWDDPRVGVAWPLLVTEMSALDREHALLSADFTGIEIA